MPYFYENGSLKIGSSGVENSIDIESLVRENGNEPVYIYDLDDIAHRYHALELAFAGTKHAIHYAMKANSHAGILKQFAALGSGVDTVSAGEIKKALAAGVPASRVIFSGVAKTITEIEFALKSGIKQINVESPQELERIAEIANRLDIIADVAFRLNPDVSPKTHPYITTGFRENKFGMDESFVPELLKILARWPKRLRLRGLTMHIGSLLFDLAVIREAIEKTIAVHFTFIKAGHHLDRLDIGGGLGVRYETDDTSSEYTMIKDYGKMARNAAGSLGVELLTEPGRVLVARAGLLVGEVQYIKPTSAKTFAILNTGMHHLIRPALYSAKHRIVPIKVANGSRHLYDVVGPICESSDFLAKDVELSELRPGDLVGIADAGAYGFAMASHYNSHALPNEILISKGTRA